MFRAIISPILRSTRLWYNAPEDGRNYRPKHVELIEIINKLLLLNWLVVYIIVSMMHGYTNIKLLYCFTSIELAVPPPPPPHYH